MAEFFIELAIVMVLVLVISLIMNKIKQPLLIGYILTGILAGPLFLDILSSNENYQAFAHIGVSLLLFIVGLNLNLKLIKEVGLISLVTGVGQVLFTSIIGFGIGYMLGFGIINSIIIAIALTFSSTIIIVKLLSDKKDLETLYGKISMGFLIVQDLIAIIILMIISSLISSKSESLTLKLFETLIFAIVSIIITIILSKWILPKFLEKIAKKTEVLFIFIISWALAIPALFQYFGFSLEIGALLAGIALASSPYQFEISARIKPLRDFFIVMFFILLGSQMIPINDSSVTNSFADKINIIGETFSPILLPAIVFSLFVLIGNPLIVLILMTKLGYSSRTGFLAGLTVAQISEFSLILSMLAKDAGILTTTEVSMVTLIGIITITGSTYLILNGEKIFKIFEKTLRKLEKVNTKEKSNIVHNEKYEVLIFGYDRIGYSILNSIKKLGKSYLVIDHNPQIINDLKNRKINCIYGDASDIEFISNFNLKDVKLFISTIPNFEINLLLLENLRKINNTATVILTSNNIDNAMELYKEGADYVILPHFLGGDYVSSMIENYDGNLQELLREKVKHINELKKRKEQGLEHPVYEK
jgi:Kef-type K+ transport system membrane component KefB/Trk K+ transport system NAD-binding subunit